MVAFTLVIMSAGFSASLLAQNISNGRQLYITPLVSGQFSCSNGQCHGPSPANNQNKILVAANDPDRIALAISQVAQMAFLKNNVNGSQLADLAAYIGNPAGANGPFATLTPEDFNFAPTVVGATSAPQQFVLGNTGNASLIVSSVVSDSADFTVTSTCTSVAPGASCTISARFAPTTAGGRSGSVAVAHNAGGSTLYLTGLGVVPTVPVASVTPAAIAFAPTVVGELSAFELLSLQNSGNAALAISAITATDAAFRIAGGNCAAGGSVAPGASCSLSIQFLPASAGERNGQIVFNHNAAGGSSSVALSGTGIISQTALRTMTEYLYAPLNYYFITSRESEKLLLDATAGFQRTGQRFDVYAGAVTGSKGITRFYFDKVARNGGRGSHFYTLVESEKAALAQLNPGNLPAPRLPFDEGIDSYAFPPVVEGVGGSCAAGQLPVFRLFRGNLRFPDDPNHRFTTSTAIYNEFVALGWDGEGVKFCVPAP